MAFSGLSVTCGMIGTKGGTSLLTNPSWSQAMATAGTTSVAGGAKIPAAPAQTFDALALGFEIQAAADSWVAWGSAPVASTTGGSTSNTACILVRAGETRNVYCSPGDQLAWIAA